MHADLEAAANDGPLDMIQHEPTGAAEANEGKLHGTQAQSSSACPDSLTFNQIDKKESANESYAGGAPQLHVQSADSSAHLGSDVAIDPEIHSGSGIVPAKCIKNSSPSDQQAIAVVFRRTA